MRTTILVLGAGASKIFGLPLGYELRDAISQDLDIQFDEFGRGLARGSHQIVQALRELNRLPDGRLGDINSHRKAAIETAAAMPFSSSIDEYIERHSDDPLKAECAKLAIAKNILEAERSSILFAGPQGTGLPHAAAGSWTAHFLRDLTRGKTRNTVARAFDDLTIVNFNYDRCFEQFVFAWLQSIYGINNEEAAQITRDLEVYHPYGRLAPLEWEDQKGVEYGAELDVHRLISIAKKIRTYSEAQEPETGIEGVKEKIAKARSIVFLGFGFHQQNLDLLALDEFTRKAVWCYATTCGISKPSWDIFRERLRAMLKVSPERDLHCGQHDGTCETFWNEYSTAILA